MVVVLVFGLPLLLAGAMISPTGVPLAGLAAFAAITLVISPFIGWPSFLLVATFPPPGKSRSLSLLNFWIGASLTVVAVIYFLMSVLGYPSPGTLIDTAAHVVIPFMPRAGLAIGLFCLSMLVSCGCWGAIAPILRSEVAIAGAAITGFVLFAFIYCAGWWLVLT